MPRAQSLCRNRRTADSSPRCPLPGLRILARRGLSLVALLFCVGCATPKSQPSLERFEFTQPQMGVPFRIVLYAADRSIAETAARAAFARISELNDIMSDYD